MTGASRGIGRAIAIGLGQAGVHVAINYHSAVDDALSAASEIEETGARAIAVHADVAKSDAVVTMVDHVEKAFGPIDILVNNAGVVR